MNDSVFSARQAANARERWALAAIVLLGLALRLLWLGSRPYWQDEVHGLIAGEDLLKMFQGNMLANHPPLTYVLVQAWRWLGMDHTEWTMRLLPALTGTATLVAVYFLGKRLGGVRAGLAAAFLLAVNPLHVHHSQELKEYIYLPGVVCVMGYCLFEAAESNRPRWWAAYAFTAGLACHTELFAAPLLVALNLWMLIRLRKHGNRFTGWILGNAGGALLVAPVLPLILKKTQDTLLLAPDWWVPAPNPMTFLFFLKAIAFGYSDLKPYFYFAMILFHLLVAAGFVVVWKRNRYAALFLGMWFVLPVLMIYALSHVTQSAFLIRSMIPYAMALFVLAGMAVAAFRPASLGIAAAGTVALIGAFSLNERYHERFPLHEMPHRPGVHPAMDSDRAARFIADRWQEGDVVVHGGVASYLPFYWYGFRERLMYTGSPSAAFRKYVERSTPRNTDDVVMDRYFPHFPYPVVKDKRRIWFVFAEWEREHFPKNPMDTWRWMDAHLVETLHQSFKNIEVFLYVNNAAGEPIHAIARTRDDGVSADLTYAGAMNGPYTKTRPDAGLVACPIEARRGNLELRFDDAAGGEPFRMVSGDAPARTIGFAIENRSGAPVQCEVHLVASDVQVDLASLIENNPERDVWRIAPLYNTEPPPREYEISVPSATLRSGTDTLLGDVALPAGEFIPMIYVLGTPGERAASRAEFDVWIGNSNLFGPELRNREDLGGWHWVRSQPVAIPEGLSTIPIRVEARPNPGLPESYVNIGWLALIKTARMKDMRPESPICPAWPGEIVVPARQTYRARVEIEADIPRVDIWVYERGEDGRAYRIFRLLQ
ncbi:MAG TPA: glycosyltransferase family 39 protein [Candidatus Hydrogenedentes bacterium]|nr:glycosyltransferase family 39 protein [Candidatus Hydrogenedentota bacterium]